MTDTNKTIDIEATDFFSDPALFDDPHPYYDAIRAKCPVAREAFHEVYMVTGYEEALQIFTEQEVWSNCNVVSGPAFPVPLVGDDISDLIEKHRDELAFSDQLPSFDPPKHTEQRGLLLRLITPKRMKENEEFMWGLADRVIDEFIDKGKCEFITEYASPYTLLVIADLLGVPESDFPNFRRRAAYSTESLGAQAHKPLEYLYEQFMAYIEDRRANPQDDAMTAMSSVTFPDGRVPSVHDVALIAANLFTAGQGTTVHLLNASLRFLGERPDVQQLLRKERHRIPNFIEEVLRLEAPIQGSFRLSKVKTTVGGVELPPGTTVWVAPGAANYDARHFEHPEQFDLDRENSRQHLTFGHGIHTCVGAPLARAEGRVTLERFLTRMADIRIDESVHGSASDRHYDHLPSFKHQGLTNLHLEFSPAG